MCNARECTLTAFTGLLVGLAAGCGSGAGGAVTPDDVVYADNLIILTTGSALQLESLDATTMRFSFSGSDAGVAPGDILSGTSTGGADGGYLRRVESVEQSSGGVLIINTTQATVDDAVDEGHFEHKIVIGAAEANISGKKHTVMQIGASEEIDISGELFNNGVLVVDIPSGTIGFSGEIDWDVDYEIFGGLESFSATFNGSVDLDLDVVVSVSAPGYYQYEVELSALPSQNFRVGIIFGQVNVIFEAGIEVDASAPGTVETGLDAFADVELGGYYDSDGWRTTHLPPSTDFNSHDWVWNQDGTVAARVFVRPKVEILFYYLAGPVFDVEPYLTFEASVDECSFDWDLTGGVSGHLNIDLGPLSDFVPPLPEVELFDSHESIASDQGSECAECTAFDIRLKDDRGWVFHYYMEDSWEDILDGDSQFTGELIDEPVAPDASLEVTSFNTCPTEGKIAFAQTSPGLSGVTIEVPYTVTLSPTETLRASAVFEFESDTLLSTGASALVQITGADRPPLFNTTFSDALFGGHTCILGGGTAVEFECHDAVQTEWEHEWSYSELLESGYGRLLDDDQLEVDVSVNVVSFAHDPAGDSLTTEGQLTFEWQFQVLCCE